MARRSLAIIAPTWSEYEAIKIGLAGTKMVDSINLYRCGVGPRQAAALVAGFDEARPPAGLALLGWAGALVSHLAPGQIVIADSAIAAAGIVTASTPLSCLPLTLAGAHSGPILTVAVPLITPASKRAAAVTGALAVEMEGYPLAAWAYAHEVPFIHARVILDSLAEPLPDLAMGLDPYGRLRLAPLLMSLATRPSQLRALWRLGRRARSLNAQLIRLARVVADTRLGARSA